MVTVFLEREKRSVERDFSGTIRTLLAQLGVNVETVVVVKNGEVVSEDEKCSGKDELKLLSVISGG
jgi:sulfur carrier protein ThiS